VLGTLAALVGQADCDAIGFGLVVDDPLFADAALAVSEIDAELEQKFCGVTHFDCLSKKSWPLRRPAR
jgi:hypothetical protein